MVISCVRFVVERYRCEETTGDSWRVAPYPCIDWKLFKLFLRHPTMHAEQEQ